jgi:ParB/RepB/Spo0J family partition protein
LTPTAAAQKKTLPFPSDANSASVNIPLGLIIRSETNRKAEVDDGFVQNIKELGVLQPIILRKIVATVEDVTEETLRGGIPSFRAGDTIYKLVAGERRWLGAKKAGRASIPAIIRELTDTQAVEIQVAENEQRENLSPLDRCHAYMALRDQYMKDHAGERGYNESKCIQDVATNRKVEVRTVYQVIALSKLHDFAQAALRQTEMEASHAYELCRLEQDQQLEVLRWIRKETQHSQGDVPSVRRLKREISQMQTAWDAKKRQAALPLEGEGQAAKAQTSAEDEEEDLVNPSQPKSVMDEYQKQKASVPKPLSNAQIKKNEEAAAADRAEQAKFQRAASRKRAIDKKYRGLVFASLISKVQINSRFLTHVVPALLFELWDVGDVPFDAFCQDVLGWPAPEGNGNGMAGDAGYDYQEVLLYSKKHTRKFTPQLLAALIMSLNMVPAESERLGKYFGVDPKRLHKKATAEVKEEERQAKIPKAPESKREKQLHLMLGGADQRWVKLRKTGASDVELRKLLGELWRNYQGFHSKELGSVQCNGGVDPSIVFDFKRKDVLKGAALLKEVRDLLKIPEKGEA